MEKTLKGMSSSHGLKGIILDRCATVVLCYGDDLARLTFSKLEVVFPKLHQLDVHELLEYSLSTFDDRRMTTQAFAQTGKVF
jgi:hypothetical protein